MPEEAAGELPSPMPLMELSTAFWAFKTLAAAHELDLFTKLSGTQGMTPDEFGKVFNIAERPSEVFLTACAALGLLEKDGQRYRNSTMADEYLVRGKRYYFGGFVTMHDKLLYPAWDKLIDAIKTNQPVAWDPKKQKSFFEGKDPVMLDTFWEGLDSMGTLTARALAEAVDFSRFKRILDVGGGSGAIDIELCKRYPHLRATIFDLPFVVEKASGKVAKAGLGSRISQQAGDFFTYREFPRGYDVILLSQILHDWPETKDREILRKCYEALPSGGAVIICELLVSDDKTGPPSAALMSLNMVVIYIDSRNYTASEFKSWLADTGFRDIRVVRFEAPGANGVVIGFKP